MKTRIPVLSAVLVLCLVGPPALLGQTRKVNPLEALRLFYGQKRWTTCVNIARGMLWNDINQPEVLHVFATSLERTGQREDAAVFYTILLNVLETSSAGDVSGHGTSARERLRVLDGSFRRLQADYVRTAPGRKFTTPDTVNDLWMTNVKCTPHPLHGLYAWKMVGGRKDAKPDWIHNVKGEMHRSAAKYVDEVNGRKGVLFCVPNKKSKITSTIVTRNVGKGRFLRVATMGYNFTCVLNVVVEDRQVFSQTIGKDDWQDLRIDMGESAGKDVPVTLELVVPEDQRWFEGIWFDYVDFFEE